MTGLTDDEIAFLRARLAEEEAAANRGLRFAEGRERDCPDAELVEVCERASRREQNYDQPWWAATVMALRQQVQLAPHDPARALRDVAVWRRLLLEYRSAPHDAVYGGTERETGFRLALSAALKAKIATYDGNPVTGEAFPAATAR